MSAVLLDTHTFIWFVTGAPLDPAALLAIAKAQTDKKLFLSPVSAWEIGVAMQKKNPNSRPDLQGSAPDGFFRRGLKETGARLVPVGHRIALEAANVPATSGWGDPGDAYIIATARFKKIPVVTQDGKMIQLAASNPGYLTVIPC
jgi:PIN domain nuclease of toxin-antitoxin system